LDDGSRGIDYFRNQRHKSSPGILTLRSLLFNLAMESEPESDSDRVVVSFCGYLFWLGNEPRNHTKKNPVATAPPVLTSFDSLHKDGCTVDQNNNPDQYEIDAAQKNADG